MNNKPRLIRACEVAEVALTELRDRMIDNHHGKLPALWQYGGLGGYALTMLREALEYERKNTPFDSALIAQRKRHERRMAEAPNAQ